LIEVLVTTEVTEVVLQQLIAQTIDLGIVMSPADALKSVEGLPLLKEELVVAIAAEHPFAGKPVLLPKDLAELAFISHLRGIALQKVQQGYFDKLGVHPQIIMEVENIEAIKSLVGARMGAALVPLCCLAEPFARGLIYKRIQGFPMSRELLITAIDWRALPPATLRLALSIIRALGGPRALKVASETIGVINEHH
jgi:LysR family transcriptional activator of glutamate synthase operon